MNKYYIVVMMNNGMPELWSYTLKRDADKKFEEIRKQGSNCYCFSVSRLGNNAKGEPYLFAV